MSKSETITTRVTPEDKAEIIKMAAESHRTVANLVSKLLAEELAKEARS
jgi:hypothetical protein